MSTNDPIGHYPPYLNNDDLISESNFRSNYAYYG